MQEVIDIIAKLELQVGGNEQLKQQVDAFKAQSAAIDELARKRDLLAKFAEKDKSAERAERAKKAIADLNMQINNQTAALTKQVQAQQLIQRAAQQELGIIQKIQDKLNDLQQARSRQTTVANIREINTEIAKLNNELKSLMAVESGGQGKGLLSSLFGVSTGLGAGKQVLQGALAGAGIGVGFSVIPALVSSLVEYSRELFDTTAQTQKLLSANNQLQQSFGNIADEIRDINAITTGSIYDKFLPKDPEAAKALLSQTSAGLQDTINKLEAIGVTNGEIFLADKQRLEAEQNLRREKNRELQKELDILNNILPTVEKIGKAGQETGSRGETAFQSTINTLKTIFSTTNTAEREAGRDRAAEAIRTSGLPKRIQDELLVSIKSAIENGARISDALDEQVRKYEAQRFALNQQLRTNLADQASAELKFKADLERKIFELNKQLTLENTQAEKQFQIEQIGRQEQTTQNIREQFAIRKAISDRAIDEEVTAARKQGILTEQIQKDFAEKRRIANERLASEEAEAIRKYNLQQLQLQQQINADLLSSELQALNQRLQEISGFEYGQNLELRNNVADKELQIERAKLSAEYDATVQGLQKKQDELRKAGQTETKEYQDLQDTLLNIYNSYNTRLQTAEAANQSKRLANIQQGYTDVIRAVTAETNDLNAAIGRAFSEQKEGISEKGGGGFFGRDFKNKIAALDEQIAKSKVSIVQNSKALVAAKDELAAASALPSTPESQKAIQAAQTQINQIEQAINESQTRVNDSEREKMKMKVDAFAKAYTEMTTIAKNAYDEISNYRQQEIKREIDAREAQTQIALELAKKGNTQVLEENRNALKQARKEERAAALEQTAINSALQLSYALLAVAKATAEGGGIASAATVAAALGALVTGYALVRQANQPQNFKDGVIDLDGPGTETSDSIPANLSKGESVMTARATRQFKEELKLMQEGIDPYTALRQPVPVSGINKSDIKVLTEIRDAIVNRKIDVQTITTKDHIAHMVKEQKRIDMRKYGQYR